MFDEVHMGSRMGRVPAASPVSLCVPGPCKSVYPSLPRLSLGEWLITMCQLPILGDITD